MVSNSPNKYFKNIKGSATHIVTIQVVQNMCLELSVLATVHSFGLWRDL